MNQYEIYSAVVEAAQKKAQEMGVKILGYRVARQAPSDLANAPYEVTIFDGATEVATFRFGVFHEKGVRMGTSEFGFAMGDEAYNEALSEVELSEIAHKRFFGGRPLPTREWEIANDEHLILWLSPDMTAEELAAAVREWIANGGRIKSFALAKPARAFKAIFDIRQLDSGSWFATFLTWRGWGVVLVKSDNAFHVAPVKDESGVDELRELLKTDCAKAVERIRLEEKRAEKFVEMARVAPRAAQWLTSR